MWLLTDLAMDIQFYHECITSDGRSEFLLVIITMGDSSPLYQILSTKDTRKAEYGFEEQV